MDLLPWGRVRLAGYKGAVGVKKILKLCDETSGNAVGILCL